MRDRYQMNDEHERYNISYYEKYWSEGVELYESHPTSRHRRRFVQESLRNLDVGPHAFVFDYGCGTGAILKELQSHFGLVDSQLGGCDISPQAIKLATESFNSEYFYLGSYPDIPRSIDVAICTEVIEHTPEYEKIIRWLSRNLAANGSLILTTPAVPMDPPDESYGHTQHFVIDDLVRLMQQEGLYVDYARQWGWPLFTLQKLITRKFLSAIQSGVIDKPMTPTKKAIFNLVYQVYYLHDYFDAGPQIFIRAKKLEQSQ